MRIKNVEQRFGNLREIIIDAQMNSSRKQGKSFEHPFNVRIFATVWLQQQARCDLGILIRKFRSSLAQEREFALVIIS